MLSCRLEMRTSDPPEGETDGFWQGRTAVWTDG
jgi:hypothetical protein